MCLVGGIRTATKAKEMEFFRRLALHWAIHVDTK